MEWSGGLHDRLQKASLDLLLLVAVPTCPPAAEFFQNLLRRPILAPTLAIVPPDDEIADARSKRLSAISATSGRPFHGARGELLLKRDPANPAPAEDAFQAAIAVAKQQATRSFELRAALALAKLYQSTGRPADAHAVLALSLDGFAPTPAMPEIAEAQALLTALAADETVKAASASRKQRVDLQVAYGSALLKGRGMGAPETRAAFERARELAAGGVTAPRPEITFGLWSAAEGRGELGAMREFADAFQREVKDSGQSFLAGIAHRVQGVTKYLAGEFLEARAQLEQAVAMSNPARAAELAHGFAADPGILATAYLAHVLWPLGQVDEARRIAEDLTSRVARASDLGSISYGRVNRAQFEMMRGDFERAEPQGKAFADAVRESNSPQWEALVLSLDGWSRWHEGDRDVGRARMREGVAKLDQLHFVPFDELFKGTLAVLEAEGGDFRGALSLIDSAIAVSDRTGFCNFDAEVHRMRGEILLKDNPADPAPAEAAYLAAIAVAQQQRARSFELRAALSLAKLYQSTGRPIDAHDVLAPVLQGFSPTPEFPEIKEALALLAALEAGAHQ